MFVRNAWYCAGWDEAVGIGANDLVVRQIAGRSILLYRTGEGRLVAMEDRCPHRSAPLSLGRKEGDAIRCMYHGMLFGPDGACRQVPGMDRIPEGAVAATLPVVEKDNWIWVWLGDPARADPELICFAIGPSDPDWVLRTSHLRVDTGYREEIANLADLSHVSWVHGLTFAGSDDWGYIKPRHRLNPRGIETRYGHLAAILVRPGDRVTRGQLIARMGSTGRSTGNHLHYEVRIDGRAVNPIPFMKSADYVVAMQRKSNTAAMESLAIGGPTGK